MATIFSHSIVGGTLAYLAPMQKKTRSFVFWMCFLPIIPDFDYLGFAMKIPYGSFWGHRGFSHSILFCFLIAASLSFLSWLYMRHKNIKTLQPLSILLLYFLALITHPLLDAMTNGGLGVAFYSPYNLTRYFFPWRPIEVSPMGIRFFSERGLVVLISEFFWIVLPCLGLILGKSIYIQLKRKKF